MCDCGFKKLHLGPEFQPRWPGSKCPRKPQPVSVNKAWGTGGGNLARDQPNPHGWCFVLGSSVVRGYDSSPLFREDCLLRIQHLQMEVDAYMKKMKEMEKEHAATEERLRKLKKEFGFSD